MSVIRIPWTKQPPAGTPIDWSNPMTKGLVLAVPLNEGGGLVANDLVANRKGAFGGGTGNPTWTKGPYGHAVDHGGVEERKIDFTHDAGFSGLTDQVSIVIGGSRAALSTYGMWVDKTNTNSDAFRFHNLNTNVLRFRLPQIGNVDTNWTWPAINEHHRFAVSWDGAVVNFAVDGYIDREDVSFSGTVTDDGDPIAIGDDQPGSFNFNGVTDYCFIWARGLTKAEITALSVNPWQIFQPRRIYLPAAAGVEETPAASTSWAWSGQALNANEDIILPASTSWAWSGQDVTDSTGIVEEVAASTTWAWSGQALYVSPNVLLGPATFNFSGQNVNANEVLSITAATSWSWSAQQFLASVSIPIPASTSWGWSGQDLNVNAAVDETIPESSSWSWVGQTFEESGLVIETIDESTSWAWSGQSITEVFDAIESPSVANFNWQGQNFTESGGAANTGNIARDIYDSLRVKQAFLIWDIDRDYPENL